MGELTIVDVLALLAAAALLCALAVGIVDRMGEEQLEQVPEREPDWAFPERQD
jgi:hypothetical protein